MRSKFERKIAQQLKDEGVPYTYEEYSYEYSEPLRKNRSFCSDCGSTNLSRVGWYTPDFFLPNDVIIEAKGRFTASDRRKMLAMKQDWPEEDIRIVFMRDNKIHKNSTTTYSEWCESVGYKWSIGTIPKEWLDGK